MARPISGSLSRCIALFGAALFILAAAAQNVSFAWQIGESLSTFHAAVLAIGSLAGAIIAPFAFLTVAESFRNREWGRAAVALVLGVVCISYASLSSLGFTASSRAALVSERTGAADAYQRAKLRFDAAAAELQTAKSLARRRELERLTADLSRTLDSLPGPTVADPQASAIAQYAIALGWKVSAAALAPWLSAITVGFLEIGAAFALLVAVGSRAAAHAVDREKIRADDDEDPPGKNRGGRPRKVEHAEALERLKAAGGKASGSLRGLAALIGTPTKTTTHRLLHELAALGAITLQATPRGVSVALA
jgi:hypothetical protein